MSLDNDASIAAFTTSATGQGGIINLNVDGNLLLSDNSDISALAESGANGGTINLDANLIIASPNENNDIIANSLQGNGGDINITSEALLGIEERDSIPENQTNDIDASSEFGFDGSISINTPDVDVTQGLTELPKNVVAPETISTQACSNGRRVGGASSFEIVGKGGVPPEPTAPIDSHNIYIGGKPVNNQTNAENRKQQQEETDKEVKTFRLADVVPARGMIIKENGDVILTAYPTPNITTGRTPTNRASCHG